MTATLALTDNGAALPGLLREDGYVLPPSLPFERWQGIVDTLQTMHRSVSWWAGDALLYGEEHYGEMAYQAVQEATGRGDDSLRQTAWVASKFPPGTRVPSLSWSHHRIAAELEPADRQQLLQEAAAEHLSTRDLIARVKAHQEAVKAIDAPAEPVCAAEAEWVPSLDDLLPEWRADLLRRARTQPEGYARGWLDCLRETGNEAAFAPGKWRD